MSTTPRFTQLPENPGVIRDDLTGTNYHLKDAKEAFCMVQILSGYEGTIADLQAELKELEDEDNKANATDASKLFTEENLVLDTDDFSDFPNAPLHADLDIEEETHG